MRQNQRVCGHIPEPRVLLPQLNRAGSPMPVPDLANSLLSSITIGSLIHLRALVQTQGLKTGPNQKGWSFTPTTLPPSTHAGHTVLKLRQTIRHVQSHHACVSRVLAWGGPSEGDEKHQSSKPLQLT